MAAVTVLETRSLTRNFAGITAVRDVSIAVERGEIRALIGPNGAGKTTLVSLICGRIPATSGAVFFKERDISRLPAHERISAGMAYTFQITSIFRNLTAYENVALAVQRGRGKRDAAFRAKVSETMARVGLDDTSQIPSGALSYGHQRLLEIAMGLGQDPELLVLDEPTQGLAASEISGFMSLIRKVAQSCTVLLIEHNMDVVMALADRITVLNMGEVIAEGSPDEIRGNRQVQEAYLGS